MPPEVSLLTTIPLTVDPDEHWGNGFCWAPEGSGNESTGVFDPACATGEDTKSVEDCEPSECFCAFIIWAADKSSTIGFNSRDSVARARRKLDAAASKLIENEIYTNSLGICTQAIGLSGGSTNFTDLTPATGAVSARQALLVLEDAVGDWGVGQQVTYHIRPGEVVPWLDSYAIYREPSPMGVAQVGQRYRSPMGNLIVPGRGYTGQGPGGQAATSDLVWAYATPTPQVRLGGILSIPESGQIDGTVVTRTTNVVTTYAERLVVVAWEKYLHLGIQIDRTLY